MRKMMLTLTTVGLLAIPAGMAIAESDATEPAGPVPTCVDAEHARDRDRTADQATQETQDQVRDQLRTQERLHDESCGDCSGDQAQYQYQYRQQDQVRTAEGTAQRQGAPGGPGNG
jgi:uncharacterized protein YcfJ